MFLDLGVVGDVLIYTDGDKSFYSTSFLPEIGMGVKVPMSKKHKLLIRCSLAFNLFDEEDYYKDDDDEEDDREEDDDDWYDKDDYYSKNNLVLRFDLGFTKRK